ncbi:molybdopterin-dependent oxidoreductase [Nitrospira sp. Nam80]
MAFHSLARREYAPNRYYEAFQLDEVRDPQTMLAYEMNGQPLPTERGAPCRLRIEHKYGYKMVKYLYRIELLETSGTSARSWRLSRRRSVLGSSGGHLNPRRAGNLVDSPLAIH